MINIDLHAVRDAHVDAAQYRMSPICDSFDSVTLVFHSKPPIATETTNLSLCLYLAPNQAKTFLRDLASKFNNMAATLGCEEGTS